MQRRNVLGSVAGAVAGLALSDDRVARAEAERPAAPKAGAARPPRIETRDGNSLFYRDWGTGEPVVFVHGWGLSSDSWQYQMVELAEKGLRCVAFDRRSHGRSSDPGRGYDYNTLADDLAAVCEVLDLRGITLVGHSMGGAEAVRYLSRHGGRRVSRLVLVGATLPRITKAPDYPEGVDPRGFDVLRATLKADRAKWMTDNEGPFWSPATSPQMKEWGRGIAFQCSLKALVDSIPTMAESDFRAELRALHLPTLIIHGTEDRSVPIHFGRLTAQLVPGCRLLEYEGAPHGLPLTHMERFNNDLLAFAQG